MSDILSLDTWRPYMSFVRCADPVGLAMPGASICGRVWRDGGQWLVEPERSDDLVTAALKAGEGGITDELHRPLWAALEESSMEGISYAARFPGPGRVTLQLYQLGPAVELGMDDDMGLGALVLAEGAVPGLSGRQPARLRRARTSATANPALLERTLRERLGGAAGSTVAQIAAAERRAGSPFPEELRVLHRNMRPSPKGREDQHLLGCDPLPLDRVHVATADTFALPWRLGSALAAPAARGPVQSLLGSDGWLVFAKTDDGERIAIDRTPGPGGHIGQVIVLHEDDFPGLLAESVTELVVRRPDLARGQSSYQLPAVADARCGGMASLAPFASRHLQVILIGTRQNPPLSLASLAGLPLVRTIIAAAGTVSDVTAVARMPALEYLQLGLAEWLALLRAGAVPPWLRAAGISPDLTSDPVQYVELANELLALFGRPLIKRTVLEGRI